MRPLARSTLCLTLLFATASSARADIAVRRVPSPDACPGRDVLILLAARVHAAEIERELQGMDVGVDHQRRIGECWQAGSSDCFLACSPGRFPKPGWVVESRHDHNLIVFTIDARTMQVTSRLMLDHRSGRDEDRGVRVQAVDFDGDGIDELVLTGEVSAGGATAGAVRVLRIERHAIRELIDLPLLYDSRGAIDDASLQVYYLAKFREELLGDGTRQLLWWSLKRSRGRRASDPWSDAPRGPAVFVLRDGRFVDVGPR